VADRVLERPNVSEKEQEKTTSNGQSRVRNQVGWARFYLTKAGILDASQRGVWTLTEARFPRKSTQKTDDSSFATDVEKEAPDTDAPSHLEELLGILRALPPAGFERICQRLLRESGFQQVVVTGRAGDGEINPLVTFKVAFRGAMQGRADKGLVLTTP
jgi:restriction system protein